MTILSSLQTLAEKYEEAVRRGDGVAMFDLKDEFRRKLQDAWPLLEAAVKALEKIAERVPSDGQGGRMVPYRTEAAMNEIARAALFSLTGEPRCPSCGAERADYEGPGRHLPECPNCGDEGEPR